MNDNKVEDVTDLVRADGTFGRIRPTFEFMKPRLSRWIAFGLGSGLSNVVPGTISRSWRRCRVIPAWACSLP